MLITGNHLIAGEWVNSNERFESTPSSGTAYSFSKGTPNDVDKAVRAAEDAFESFGYSTSSSRAELLNKIADEIDVRGDAITKIAMEETGLPEARLIGERGRTTGQLRIFAEHILKGDYLDIRHDVALPKRQPMPRPDLWMVQRPIGPVGVFGASNFPLAFSVAGGDTAAALAAGCPVVVKAHSAHPGTSEIVADAIYSALKSLNLDMGIFSMIQANNRNVGEALVTHPLIKAIGFTGSVYGGRALFNLCALREEPIPFFGELGSVNPQFLLENALENRGSEIAKGWASSLTMGAGQFCTNPGITFLVKSVKSKLFIEEAVKALENIAQQTMLTDGISNSYKKGVKEIQGINGIEEHIGKECLVRGASPYLFSIDSDIWFENETLSEEVFGPLGLVVLLNNEAEFEKIARALKGQLSITIHNDNNDENIVKTLLPIVERKAGRLLSNGFSTGVEVSDTMVHSGPYPASTNFGATSVGTLSIRRFLRPVCYQNIRPFHNVN